MSSTLSFLTLRTNSDRYPADTFAEARSVLCNCDDPYESNFFKYFAMNFRAAGPEEGSPATCYSTARPVEGEQLSACSTNCLRMRRKAAVQGYVITDADDTGLCTMGEIEQCC
jgi:hypothetical protein